MNKVKWKLLSLLSLVAFPAVLAESIGAQTKTASSGTYTTTVQATFTGDVPTPPQNSGNPPLPPQPNPPVIKPQGGKSGTSGQNVSNKGTAHHSSSTISLPLNNSQKSYSDVNAIFTIDYVSDLTFNVNSARNLAKGQFEANAQLWNDGTKSPNYVQVTDNRGLAAGWQVTGDLSQFTAPAAKTNILKGATVEFTNVVLDNSPSVNRATAPQTVTLNPEASSILLLAQKSKGVGTTVEAFGGTNTPDLVGDKSIILSLPYGSTAAADQYVATLTWNLTSAPT